MDSWFKPEVFRWRTGASIAWSVLLLPSLVKCMLAIILFSPLHPYQWILDWFSAMFSMSTWLYTGVIIAVTISVASSNASNYSVRPVILLNRLSIIGSLLKPQRIVHCLGHALAAALTMWCLVNIIGGSYADLTSECHEESEKVGVCLNERHLVLVLHGLFLGAIYSTQYYLHNLNYLTFPTVQQTKYFRVRCSLFPMLVNSGRSVLRQLPIFYLVYYIFGCIPKGWIVTNLGLKTNDVAVDSIWGLLDISLCLHLAITGLFLHFTWTLSVLLFKVYNTEPYVFPIESSFELDKQRCLHNALEAWATPLIQYLGFLDLSLLAKYSAKRRKEILSLSQPGGHPHNWNYICTECLHTLDALTNALLVANNNMISSAGYRQLSGDQVPLQEPTSASVSSVGQTTYYNTTYNTSLNDSYGGNSTLPGYDANLSTKKSDLTYRGRSNGTLPAQQNIFPAVKKQSGVLQKFLEQQKKRPAVAYLLDSLPDNHSRQLFQDAQLQIWALQALSHLVEASYTEDTYGVVQKSLPDIIAAILTLQEAVEKHFKLNSRVNRRGQGKGSDVIDIGLRLALKSELKTAIYRIINTFGTSISNVPLSKDHSKRLALFLEYKE
ncbi:unnamed protein product [Owenia fusiformis]|uniref:Uncharacterized protein n=1 Tax=Owenia fusiformis TaxID=6347 RepID=A0A8J1TPY3_OWEFU|nr:unnamed protein product [Owenia fusiformis]